ncbi:hypothetical protein DdX_11012 [Ditylenchus destructor]|uniref:Uncharacterized protein n=1 Tax=Ditylenchus destructor TaxID=166010 RepID=A0AAD4N082_9BILA|nr:hypothetical protein DdX_11012 [Ditylenchus destructor]
MSRAGPPQDPPEDLALRSQLALRHEEIRDFISLPQAASLKTDVFAFSLKKANGLFNYVYSDENSGWMAAIFIGPAERNLENQKYIGKKNVTDKSVSHRYSSFGADNPMEVFRKRRSPDSAPFRIRSVNLDDISESRLRNDGIV